MGSKVVYHAGEVKYATTELLRDEYERQESERSNQFTQTLNRLELNQSSLHKALKKFNKSRLLVLGDTIVDQYIACDAIGISAEAPVMVVKELETREYLGGAGVVAAHVRALGAKAHFLSVVGKDANAQVVRKQLKNYKVSHKLLVDAGRPTTFKMR